MVNYFKELITLYPKATYTVAAGVIEVGREFPDKSHTYSLKVGHTQQEEDEFFSHINKDVVEYSAYEIYENTTVWFTDGSYAIIALQYDGYNDRYYYNWDSYKPYPIHEELL